MLIRAACVDFVTEMIHNEKSDILVLEVEDGIVGFSLVQEKETPKISCMIEKSLCMCWISS